VVDFACWQEELAIAPFSSNDSRCFGLKLLQSSSSEIVLVVLVDAVMRHRLRLGFATNWKTFVVHDRTERNMTRTRIASFFVIFFFDSVTMMCQRSA
jgi:hypothetical protein